MRQVWRKTGAVAIIISLTPGREASTEYEPCWSGKGFSSHQTLSLVYLYRMYSVLVIPRSTHRVAMAMATFWRTFHHDGKISRPWWGWGGARPIPYDHKQSCGVPSSSKGRYPPYFFSSPLCTLWVILPRVNCSQVENWLRWAPPPYKLSLVLRRSRLNILFMRRSVLLWRQ